MISKIFQAIGNGVFDMQLIQKEQEEILDQKSLATPPVPKPDRATISPQAEVYSKNMMNRNFASAPREESKYISGLKEGLAVEQQMTMSRKGIIVAAAAEMIAKDAFWYGNERIRQARTLKDSTESNEENFKKIRNDIEQQAQKAVATDENGNPIEGFEASSMPEVPNSSPAPAPTVAVHQASTAVQPPSVEVTGSTSGPSILSVDIKI